MDFKNISIRQLKNHKEAFRYSNLLKSLKPKNDFLGKAFDLETLAYGKVREIEKEMLKIKDAKDIDELFDMIRNIICDGFKVSEDQFWDAPCVQLYAVKNYLEVTMTSIRERERQLLQSISIDSALWEEAGGERLNVFGDILPLVKLGRIYGVYPFELYNKPYNEIILLLVLHKTDDEVNKNYNDLKSKFTKKPS